MVPGLLKTLPERPVSGLAFGIAQRSTGMAKAYAVVNENATGDGYVVMGNMMNGGRGMGMMP